jgi:hypothetical protein
MNKSNTTCHDSLVIPGFLTDALEGGLFPVGFVVVDAGVDRGGDSTPGVLLPIVPMLVLLLDDGRFSLLVTDAATTVEEEVFGFTRNRRSFSFSTTRSAIPSSSVPSP